MTEQQEPQKEKPRLKDIILSTVCAAFGVQSSKNRKRDFVGGNFKIYVISGIIFVVLFIGTVIVIVNTILKNAGV